MEIKEIKDLMAQFDASNLREFSFKTKDEEISFSKNEYTKVETPPQVQIKDEAKLTEAANLSQTDEMTASLPEKKEGQVVDSPLVGVAYLAPSPGEPNFVSVGDQVKKGQTLLIIEAMKVMNEVPSPCDGIVTEILVANEEVIEFGKGLVRIT
ncbi:acetyl-CoA carboxylase biotin carboxyl carrier protein [Streptococcus didelphis]|nr:acetyl-CoA carboxylase biotin carboxyl carrier protein [Streptococcus didelphis]WMB29331.1 acetyl-CoA carboxylase biotin carboxyl carrier protein [Streptococcus didelphis]